jgi:ribosomal protein L11 methyltransferase
MEWIEITVTTTKDASEAIAGKLMDMGANGVEFIDRDEFRQMLENNKYLDFADNGLIDRYGPDVVVKTYFANDRSPASIAQELKLVLSELAVYMDTGPGEIQYANRDDSEWKDVWKQHFKPFKFTDKIVIKPSWEEYTRKADEIIIEMDPGMAFGTGTHETTRMCAAFGEKYIRSGDKVLDLGCGTAILAILAVKLGAEMALAVDIDDAAVKAAKLNVDKNGESQKIEVRYGELKNVEKAPYDLIFINIIADIIISLAKSIKDYVKSGTKVILSGIIKERKAEVIKAYSEEGFIMADEMTMGEWEAMVFRA